MYIPTHKFTFHKPKLFMRWYLYHFGTEDQEIIHANIEKAKTAIKESGGAVITMNEQRKTPFYTPEPNQLSSNS